MRKVKKLRKKYPLFIYQGYRFKQRGSRFEVCYRFKIEPNLKFETEISIKNANPPKNNSRKILENLIFHLGLIEMLNYWKLTSSPEIKIEAGILNKEQIKFLRKIILKGMAQYFYENKIDFNRKNFLKIKSNIKHTFFQSAPIRVDPKKYLIPIGGGKDSIVVIELLKKERKRLGSFILNPQKPQLKIVKLAKIKENIFVERKLDPQLFKLNRAGFLNGHVPFSAFLAFLSLLLAYLFGYKRVAFAWEKSSNQPNLKYRGRWVNHQWSKSQEFEKMFSQYSKKYLLKNVQIFSPIRKFSELEIAKIFSKLKKYHSVFVSCNQVYKINRKIKKWCGKCSKCLFTFLVLYPFLKEEELIRIFGKNLFKDKKLLTTMEQLLGMGKFRPFECVGTKEETKRALLMAQEKVRKEKRSLPYLLKFFNK